LADDLRAGLEAAGIAGPYILVGHSMAGYNMRLFANRHPAEVVGMVLVDPSIDGNEAPLRAVSPAFGRGMDEFHATAGRCIRATAEGQMTPDNPVFVECGSPPPDSPMANAALARTALSEQESMDESSRQVLDSQPAVSALPLIVLTAGGQNGPQPGMPESERNALTTVTRANHAAIAARSSAGIHRVVEGAPHNIQWAQPDAVVAAILQVAGSASPSRP
jgi:pimeloyl-ACP methyl ester carboxylesterase